MSIMRDVHDLISTTKASVSSQVEAVHTRFKSHTTDNEKSDKLALMNKTLAERFILSHVKAYVEKRYEELKDTMVGLAVDLSDTNVSVLPGTRHVIFEDDQFFYQVNVKRGASRLDQQKLKIALVKRGWTVEDIAALIEESSNTSAPQTIHEIIPK